jgi:hypothetical protein
MQSTLRDDMRWWLKLTGWVSKPTLFVQRTRKTLGTLKISEPYPKTTKGGVDVKVDMVASALT